jgi:FkbM family methyltransferase
MLVDTRDILGSSLATRRLWEPHVTPLFQTLLSDGDVFVDVGAHIGYHTLIASRIVGSSGRVYALEPHPPSRTLLEANLRRNGVTNVRSLGVAAGAEIAAGVLFTPPSGDAARMSVTMGDGDEGGEVVTIMPVSDVVESDDATRLTLVKIDVEGFEDRVLAGLQPLLSGIGLRPAIILEMHGHLNPAVREPVAEFCRQNGMAVHLIRDDEGFDRRFSLPRGAMMRPVTLDWIVSAAPDHVELLIAAGWVAP